MFATEVHREQCLAAVFWGVMVHPYLDTTMPGSLANIQYTCVDSKNCSILKYPPCDLIDVFQVTTGTIEESGTQTNTNRLVFLFQLSYFFRFHMNFFLCVDSL